MDARRQLGNAGEHVAADFLREKGYLVQAVQYRTPYGEIDLVCMQDGVVVFVEVKTKTDDSYGYPEEMVTRRKLATLAHSAEHYLQEHSLLDRAFRVDVVAVECTVNPPKITHLVAVDGFEGSW